jgi:hypothetical protein
MTIDEMIEAIAQDAYEGATNRDLAEAFIEYVTANLKALPEGEIAKIYVEIVEGAA